MLRKGFILVTILLLLLGMTGSVFANKFMERETILLTDGGSEKTGEYSVVNILMGGEDVISDVPAILYELNGKTRTLVPIRFISENLGATVSWDQPTKTATIKLNGKEVKLQIDNSEAYVNGQVYELPNKVPPKLLGYDYNYRTMVPVRFVTEQLGLEVGWIQETLTVTVDKPMQVIEDITYDSSKKLPEIRIQTTGDVDASSYFLEASDVGGQDRIVIDIPNTVLDLDDKTILDASGMSHLGIYEKGIMSVGATQLEVSPYKTRVVIEVSEPKGYEIDYLESTSELRVRFINSIRDIRTENIYNAETVIVKTGEAPAYNVKYWNNKVIVDVINSVMTYNEGVNGSMPIHKGGIEKVSYSQFDPSDEYDPDDVISRIVVSLEGDASLEDVYVEDIDNDVYVYVSGNPLANIDYGKDDVDVSHLNITTSLPTAYDADYSRSKQRLTLKIDKTAADFDAFDMDIDDNIIDEITIDSSDDDYYVIKAYLADNTIYVDNTGDAVSNSLSFLFVNESLSNLNYANKLIVIDPGHGGKDPGAISPFTNKKEKEFVLDIGLKLKRKLENIGYKVYMTRDYDTYIGLYDRAEIANELGANVFVSIHINASAKEAPNGVEMLYVPETGRDNYGFARMMQNELVRVTRAFDRGLSQRPNLVVIRETNMPAVLAECGFLTNAAEESKLNSDAYIDQIVEGLYQGIIKYTK